MKTKQLEIEKIQFDDEVQSREELSEPCIEDYAQDMEEGIEFPPVDVFFDGENYFLADGFHRCKAALKAGKDTIAAIIHKGSRRKAILFSVGVNAKHGLRRTNKDKRKAVMKLLKDSEWSKWSNGMIAEKCGVSQPFVGKMRDELTSNGYESPAERKGADGRKIDTTDIGSKSKPPEEEPLPLDGETDDLETEEVEMDLPETEKPPETEETGEEDGDEEDENEEDSDEEGEEEELSEKETKDLVAKVYVLIDDLAPALIGFRKKLREQGNVSKAFQKLKNMWVELTNCVTELIEE